MRCRHLFGFIIGGIVDEMHRVAQFRISSGARAFAVLGNSLDVPAERQFVIGPSLPCNYSCNMASVCTKPSQKMTLLLFFGLNKYFIKKILGIVIAAINTRIEESPPPRTRQNSPHTRHPSKERREALPTVQLCCLYSNLHKFGSEA
jgi:hypothetical protein